MERVVLALSVFFSLAASSALAGSAAYPAQWSSSTRATIDGRSGGSGGALDNSLMLYTADPNNSLASNGAGNVSSNVTFGGIPAPYVLSTATSSTVAAPNPGGLNGGHADSSGDLQYYIEIVGPANPNTIALNVDAYGYANSTAYGSANANLWLEFYGGPPYLAQQYFQAVSNNGAPAAYININQTFQAYVNEPIYVELQANAQAYSSCGYAGAGDCSNSANAYIDPYFSLSSALINEGYQIEVLSPGIGNSPVSAPGPTAGCGLLSLMLLMLAGVAARTRALSAS